MNTKLITIEVSMKAPPSKLRLAVSEFGRADVDLSISEVVGKPEGELLRSDALRSHIEAQLTTYGDPLRWSITHIDRSNQIAHIEAVVTTI